MSGLGNALLTDSYQLTMLQSYLDQGMTGQATFEFFVRRLPRERSFLVCAGVEEALDYLTGLSFAADEIRWLRSTGRFKENLLRYLERFRFTGEVWALPEGEIFFANEPVLRIQAPLPEAQLVETRIINLLQHPILVASKAARCVLAARGRVLVDFGFRRAHGAEAGLWAARASYLAGFDGTSAEQAGYRYGIPVFGTMAHSFVEAHDDECEAFEHFARSNPEHTTLLIDTYDTEGAAGRLRRVARSLEREGIRIQGVRLDSGDLAEHARQVRAILDAEGLGKTRIFASGSLDERVILDVLRRGAPIDGFGVGTHLTTSSDVPFLDCAYKLEEYAGVPRFKRSEEKATLPGIKQVRRFFGADGRLARDRVVLQGEEREGVPLLRRRLKWGRRMSRAPRLEELRKGCRVNLGRLPLRLRSLDPVSPYPVKVSTGLLRLVSSRAQDSKSASCGSKPARNGSKNSGKAPRTVA